MIYIHYRTPAAVKSAVPQDFPSFLYTTHTNQCGDKKRMEQHRPLLPCFDNSSFLQVRRMAEVYSFIYNQYGIQFRLDPEDYIFWTRLESLGLLEKYLKWLTARLVSLVLRQEELPKLPGRLATYLPWIPQYGLTRQDDAYWRTRIRSRCSSRPQVSFAFSLLQGKAGSLPSPDWMIQLEVDATLHHLTSETPDAEQALQDTFIDLKEMIDEELRRTVREVYGKYKDGSSEEKPWKLPSIKAGFQAARKDGGILGEVNRRHGGWDFQPHSYLERILYTPRGTCELRSPLAHDDVEEYLDGIWYRALRTELKCQPIGLTEPFKVRVITCGDADVYTAASWYQKQMWAPLANKEYSCLVGQPLSAEILRHFASLCDTDDDKFFISADYQAATDYLDPESSRVIISEICRVKSWSIEVERLLCQTLTVHKILMPDGTFRLQVRGQLMGCPISFPVLCLHNLSAARKSCEIADNRTYRLDELPLLVNGDDLLFRASKEGYETWKTLVEFSGLIPSVGKTYVHKRLATLNSEMWCFENRKIRLGGHMCKYFFPTPVGHIEMGKCRGSIKGGTATTENLNVVSEDEKLVFNRTRMWQEFLDSCPKKEEAWQFMWDANWSVLQRAISISPKSAICLPRSSGGIGFPAPPDTLECCEKRKPTPHQLMIARYCIESPQDRNVQKWLSATSAGGLHSLSLFRGSEFENAKRCAGVRVDWTTVDTKEKPIESPIPAISFAHMDDYNESFVRDIRRALTNLCHSSEAAMAKTGRFLMTWKGAWRNSKIVQRTSKFLM